MTDKCNLWDIINDLSYQKTGNCAEKLEDYNPFVVDRFFSKFPDTIVFADVSNQYGFSRLPKIMHHDFYLYVVSRRWRRKEWYKKEEDEIISILMERYGVNSRVASDYLKVLTEEEREQLRNKTNG